MLYLGGLEVGWKFIQSSMILLYKKSEINGLHFCLLNVNGLSQINFKYDLRKLCTLETSYFFCMMYLEGLGVGQKALQSSLIIGWKNRKLKVYIFNDLTLTVYAKEILKIIL